MLYLVHHGEAVGPEVDPMRPLSDRGRAEIDLLAQSAAARGVMPAVIWHSGKLRARQTAEILLEELNRPCEIVTTANLTPYAPVEDLWRELREYAPLSPVVVVGHNPQLSEFVSTLIGSPRYAVEMKKAAIAYVKDTGAGPAPAGRLTWMLTAKLAEV